MTNHDASIRIDVDPTNPGQFFACCGLLELAARLWNGAEGWFMGHEFCLRHAAPMENNSAESLLRAIINCRLANTMTAKQVARLRLLSEIKAKEREKTP